MQFADLLSQMTGLDIDNDDIIEIFCIITNGNLDVIDEKGWGAVIRQSKETMDKMVQPITPLCLATTKQHRANGALESMARTVLPQRSSHRKPLPNKQPPNSSNTSRNSCQSQTEVFWPEARSMQTRRFSDRDHTRKSSTICIIDYSMSVL